MYRLYILILVCQLSSKTLAQSEQLSEYGAPPGSLNRAGRFVADASKAHLIQKVDAEELEKLRDSATSTTTTTIKPEGEQDEVDREDEKEEESSEVVHFAYTEHSLPTMIWNEVLNLSSWFGRSIYNGLYVLYDFLSPFVMSTARYLDYSALKLIS